tara:strand:+ start:168 stop:464 length:297 start_codon:yes stop_codon:yes gene_type:complete
MKKDKEESEIVEAMINNAGYVGTTFSEDVGKTLKTQPGETRLKFASGHPINSWSNAVDAIESVVKLHCDDLLRRKGYTRKAHEEAAEIKKHWERILQG